METIVQDFIKDLDNIVIYKQDDIERLIKDGDKKRFEILINSHFIVTERIIEVNPRPDFIEETYIKHSTNEVSEVLTNTIEMELYEDTNNDLIVSNPMYDQFKANELTPVSYQKLLHNLHNGTIAVITAKGGYGKTISTAYILKHAIELRVNDHKQPIPVLIECKTYTGNVCELINRRLRLTHGMFYQIEASFLIILDAIDELSQSDLFRLLSEVSLLIESYPISVVITQRNNTLNSGCIKDNLVVSYGIMQLSLRQMSDICRIQGMDYEESKEMIFKYIELFKDTGILYSPFVIVKTVEFYKANNSLPDNALSLLDFYILSRFQRNKTRIGELSSLYTVHDITRTYAFLANHMLFRCVSSLQLTEARQACKENTSDLSRVQFLTYLTNFEIMHVVDGICSFQHQILAYYFGSMQLNPDQLISLVDEGKERDMLMILSVSRLTLDDAIHVIQHISLTDLVLASKCALSIGNDAVNALLPVVEAKYRSNRPFDIWEATTSYGILKSPTSYKTLLHDIATEIVGPSKKSNIRRALLMMGEESQSSEVLNEAEQNYSLPFNIKITPNPWNYIPIHVRYRLAIERIVSARRVNFRGFNEFTNGFCFSMRFIYYTVPSDDIVLFCKYVLDATARLNSWKTFYNAFFIVLRDDNKSDVPYLKDMLNKSLRFEERLEILIESYKLGYVLFDDIDVLNIIDYYNRISCEEQLPSSSSNTDDTKQNLQASRNQKNMETLDKIESFLDLVNLRNDHLQALYSYFDRNIFLKKRSFIWGLLGKYKYHSMLSLIKSIIKKQDIDTCALATLYLKESEASEMFLDDYTQLLTKLCHEFCSYNIRLFLNHLERNQRLDDVLLFIIPRLYAGFKLGDSEADYSDLRDPQTLLFNREVGLLSYLQMYLSHCPQIDKDILKAFIKDRELLVFNEARNMVGIVLDKTSFKELVLAIENQEFAMEPQLVKELLTRDIDNKFKAIIGEEVFRNRRLLVWKDILELVWHDSTIQFAIERLIRESSLPSENSEISQLQDLNGLVTKTQAESIIGPLLDSSQVINEVARRTLELWYDVGIRKKH